MTPPSRGFVYVATGEGYVREAIRSARSLKRVMPEEKVCLITDLRPQESCFDLVLDAEEPVHAPIDKLQAVRAPFERVMFVDTDTHFVADVSEVFDLCARFDLAVLPDLRRGWNYPLPGVPRTFPEFNTGVMLFTNSPKIHEFFNVWRSEYKSLKPNLPVPKNDQPSFRKTLFHSDLRVAPLPSEYHFLSDCPNSIMWDARLIHGRSDYQTVEREVNRELGSRVYIPGLGVYRGFHGRKSMLSQCFRFLAASLRLISGNGQRVAPPPVMWHKASSTATPQPDAHSIEAP